MACVCRFYCEQYILVYFGNKKKKKNYSVTDEYFIIQKDNNTKHSQGTTSPNQLWNPIKVKHRVTSRESFVFVIIFL